MAFPILPLLGVAGATGLLNFGSSLAGNAINNSFNSKEAQINRDWSANQNAINRQWQQRENQINRDWQSGESSLSRQWEEYMYNQYNSPSAMKRQYLEAGINPYLAGSPLVGSVPSAPMSGSPSSGSPSSLSGSAASASPAGASFGFNPAAMASLGADIANTQAKTTSEFMRTAVDIYKNLGKDAYQKFVDTFAPILSNGSPEQSLFSRQAESQIRNLEIQNAVQDYGLELTKRFEPQLREVAIKEANQRIAASVGQLEINRDMSRAEIKRLAAQCIESAWNAFKLRQEGTKASVEADQLSALRQYVVKVARAEARLRENDVVQSDALRLHGDKLRDWMKSPEGQESMKQTYSIPLKRNSDEFMNMLDHMMSDWFNVSTGTSFVKVKK